jgi:hypothetical protein
MRTTPQARGGEPYSEAAPATPIRKGRTGGSSCPREMQLRPRTVAPARRATAQLMKRRTSEASSVTLEQDTSLDLDQCEPSNFTYVFPLGCSNSEVERCQQEPCVLNAMARGQSPALSAMALAGGRSRASSSAYARSAMEAVNVAVMSAAAQQKLNPIHSND